MVAHLGASPHLAGPLHTSNCINSRKRCAVDTPRGGAGTALLEIYL